MHFWQQYIMPFSFYLWIIAIHFTDKSEAILAQNTTSHLLLPGSCFSRVTLILAEASLAISWPLGPIQDAVHYLQSGLWLWSSLPLGPRRICSFNADCMVGRASWGHLPKRLTGYSSGCRTSQSQPCPSERVCPVGFEWLLLAILSGWLFGAKDAIKLGTALVMMMDGSRRI